MPTFAIDERGSSSSNVSEVKPDELARMIEGVNVEETPKRKIDPKTSNILKSSIKSSPSNSQRKVQFTKERKNQDFEIDLDDPLGDLDLSDNDSINNDTKKLETKTNQPDMKSNIDRPSSAKTFKAKQNNSKPLSPLKVNDTSINNVGNFLNFDDKSSTKTMLPQTKSPPISSNIPRRTSLQPALKQILDDDLFSLDGKASPKREFSPARLGSRRNSSFMSDLFGNKKYESKIEAKGDFILDEKYKNAIASSTISENGSDVADVGTPIKKRETSPPKANLPRRGRRGTAPTLNLQEEPGMSINKG